ncbi:MAG: hypothetical protein OXF46_07670 [Rhodobacteraceae bacterium]|nr:hypothetical protein [Paracoccaceae bacterium]
MEILSFLNPLTILNGLVRLFNWWKIRRIRRHAPSTKMINLIVTMTREDYDALPEELKKQEILYVILEDQE